MSSRFFNEHARLFTYSAVGVVILLALIVLFWVLPMRELRILSSSLAPKDYLELKGGIRNGLAQAIGGAAILLGLFFSWRNIRATEKNLEISHETNARNLAIAQEGQITERFTRAIDQLGSDKLQVRLGGIYALERIARDSRQDHWPVMEILTAFVRDDSVVKSDSDNKPRRTPTADIEAVLTVLSRRNLEHENNTDQRIDLRGANLRSAILIGCHLEKSILWEADLTDANLRAIHLESAGLHKACLNSAALISAHMQRATLGEVDMENAACSGANLEGAQLSGANLHAATLYDANLSGANLFGANLTEAILLNANLSGAILKDAQFAGANLSGADLTGTIGLTFEQVNSAVNYDCAKLPPKIEEVIAQEGSGNF